MKVRSIRCRSQTLLLAAVFASFAIAAGAEEFLVGVETPLSGSLTRVETGMSEGIQVATDVFNYEVHRLYFGR